MRVVLDTNIIVRAGAKGRGPARELLHAIVHSPDHILLLSPFLLQEVERVRSYERVRLIAKLTDEEIVEHLAFLRAEHVSEPVFPGPAPRIVPSDVNDDPVVYTAIVGRADALCTLNRDFFHPSVREYCRLRGVLVATDVEMLRLLRSQA